MKRMMRVLMLVSLVAMLACDARRPEDSNEAAEEANEDKFTENDSEKDADFVADLVAANYEEIKLAQVARQRSADTQVKEIASLLETQHAKQLNDLKALAASKSISVPVEEDDGARNRIKKISDETQNFDEKWCKEQIDGHEDMISDLEARKDNTEDEDLKAWIDKVLPEMRSHLDKVKACHERIKDANG
ncbi:MAG: DUF4142 domain-containing protein [Bacteroidota bacterium]